jgi:hypothetical protein
VRLLLDAHLSSRRVGGPLRRDGHDVHAIGDDRGLDGLTDPQVLELAVQEERMVVTVNAKHFAPLLRTWAEAGRHHTGCILLWGFRSEEFGPIVIAVRAALEAHPDAEEWRNLVLAPRRR